MPRLIKQFEDGSFLEYDSGKFDGWCIYLTRPNGPRHPPEDGDYFAALQSVARQHPAGQVYTDLVAIYQATDKLLRPNVLDLIACLAKKYGRKSLVVEILYTIVYAGMVAEENKEYGILGKKVKRLGLHQVLVEDMNAVQAANFSMGRGWRDIEAECRKRGF